VTKQESIRGIEIDPFRRTVEAIDFPGGAKDISDILSANPKYSGLFCCSYHNIAKRDVDIFVCDEGMIIEGNPVFMFNGEPLAGIGLVIEHDAEGDSASFQGDIEAIRCAVQWTRLVSSGELGPMSEFQGDDGFFHIHTGTPILKKEEAN
jgi:hypothetical protein